ncbi:MAG: hypothetical protein POELPBGB_00545 [Bacteroidia bacterium]|nr:hypothetical protein [Bacteroidia bacterium]
MKKLFLLVTLFSITVIGCREDEYQPPVVNPEEPTITAQLITDWLDNLVVFVRESELSGPEASRVFAYCGVAMYEGVYRAYPTRKSLAGQLNGLNSLPQPTSAEYNWGIVASTAQRVVASYLFSDASVEVRQTIISLNEIHISEFRQLGISDDVVQRSKNYGTDIGNAITAWAVADGFASQASCNYTIPQGAGLWEPTFPQFSSPLLPCWKDMRPFVINPGSLAIECNPGIPTGFSNDINSTFYAAALEVYNTVNSATDEQEKIARFWEDAIGTVTPPGHAISILSQVIKAKNVNEEIALEAYVKTGLAMADGYISSWTLIYDYNVLRPSTFIQEYIDPSWQPLFYNPNYPAYTSLHAVCANAAAQVMSSTIGENIVFTDNTHALYGLSPRYFNSFYEYAEEAGMAELYAGFNYRSAIDNGEYQGRCIGQAVNDLTFKE